RLAVVDRAPGLRNRRLRRDGGLDLRRSDDAARRRRRARPRRDLARQPGRAGARRALVAPLGAAARDAVRELPRDGPPLSRLVLVTGGGGFIGSHLVRGLLERGERVRVLDNFSTGNRANLLGLDDVEVLEGELRSYERVHAAVRDVEVVFHQGALPSVPRSVQDPLTMSAVNVEGTLNVLLAARDSGVRRVVFASSSSVYGNSGDLPRREPQPTDPLSPY